MSKEQENIDQKFKDKLSQRTFGTPPSAFLDDLNSRLDAREKGIILPSWMRNLLTLLFVLLVAILTIYVWKNQEKRNLKPYLSENNIELNSESKSNDEKGQKIPPLKQKGNEKKELTHDLLEIKETTPNSLTETKTVKPEDDEENPSEIGQSEPSIFSDSSDQTTAKRNMNDKALPSSKQTQKTVIDTKVSEEKIDEKPSTNSLNEKEHDTENKIVDTNKTSDEETEELDKESNISDSRIIPIDSLAMIGKEDDATPLAEAVEMEKDKDSTLMEKEDDKDTLVVDDQNDMNDLAEKNKLLRFELQVFGGIAHNQLQLSGNHPFESQLKNEINNPLRLTAGINANLYLKNWMLGTGVSYTSTKEKNNYFINETYHEDSVFIQSSVLDSIEYIIDENDSIIIDSIYYYTDIYDSVEVEKMKLSEKEIAQAYSWIQIPIHFGYQFQFNNWAITPSIGANIAIGILNKNKYYPNNLYLDLDELESVRWHVNLAAYIEVRRRFNQWHVFAKGGYHHTLTPYLREHDLNIKYNQFIGVVGIGYSF